MNPKIILLDDARSLEKCTEALTEAGVDWKNILPTTSTEKALEFLTRNESQTCIFVCNFELAHGFGDEVIRRVMKKFPKVCCILMGQAKVEDKAQALGVPFFLKKNRTCSGLGKAVITAYNSFKNKK